MTSTSAEMNLYKCSGCKEMIDYNMLDGKSGLCGDCYYCGDCGCKCEEEDDEDEEETEYVCCVCSNIHIPEAEINFTCGGLICDECYYKPEEEVCETCDKTLKPGEGKSQLTGSFSCVVCPDCYKEETPK